MPDNNRVLGPDHLKILTKIVKNPANKTLTMAGQRRTYLYAKYASAY